MAKEVSFVIRIDDKGTLKRVTMDSRELEKAIGSVRTASEEAQRQVISWAEAAQAVDVLHGAIGELQGVMQDLTSAYQVQLVAETQLDTIMRQRMGATDAMVQSVKDLCSAQQELGVVGDEVQLSGAQQMATFLNEKASLDTLIPAMNNLIAQQEGLHASTQGAVSIGNMMGKAMQGQVEVLQRVGITFTDAQKQVLQYGDESERAAMLAQVITDNVGEMNAQLAKTDAGRQQQLENTLGDIKEQLGQVMQRYSQFITLAAQTTTAVTGLMKVYASVRSVTAALRLSTMASRAWSAASVRMAALTRLASSAMRGAAVSATTLKLALQGLLISTGVGIAIVALTEAISWLITSADDASSSLDRMSEAEQRAQQAHRQEAREVSEVRSAMELSLARLKEFSGTKEQEKKLVDEMNQTYGATMGYYSSVAQWYTALTANSEAYCQQMIREVRLRRLASEAADLAEQKHGIIYDEKGKKRRYATEGKSRQVKAQPGELGAYQVGATWMKFVRDTSPLDEAKAKLADLSKQEAEVKRQMAEIAAGGDKVTYKRTEGWSATAPSSAPSTAAKTTAAKQAEEAALPLKGSIDFYEMEIRRLGKELGATADEGAAQTLQKRIEKKQEELRRLKVRIGIEPPSEEDMKDQLRISGLKIEPIKVDIDTSDIDAAEEKMQGATASVQQMGQSLSSLGSAIGVPEINVAGMMAQAVATMIAGYADATKMAGKLGPWAWVAFAATGMAQLAAMISSVKSMGAYATGGIVPGSSRSGDRLTVRVNSGEMILNASQQARLFAIANGAAVYGEALAVGSQHARSLAPREVKAQLDALRSLALSQQGAGRTEIDLRVRGRDLVKAAANELRSTRRRSGLR